MFSMKCCLLGIWLFYKRYIEYMCDMVVEEFIMFYSKFILVRVVVMMFVLLFSKQRSGCRFFCEVYVGDECVVSIFQEYDKMWDFKIEDGKVVIFLGVMV